MTFKEFNNWCNDRAIDGCWSMEVAELCIRINTLVNKKPFWKREKFWRNEVNSNSDIENIIVNPINKLINKP